MLISDWSSDVCSSDLKPPSIRLRRKPRDRKRYARAAGGSCDRYLAFFLNPLRLLKALDCLSLKRKGPAERSAGPLKVVFGFNYRPRLPARCAMKWACVSASIASRPSSLTAAKISWTSPRTFMRCEVARNRSEEHTSELQTLIR